MSTPDNDGTVSRAPFGRALRKDFLFDEKYINFNHGSFGTYPYTVQSALRAFQSAAESRPDPFIRFTTTELVNTSRAALASLLNAPLDTLVFVPNATTGINTVLRNLVYEPGDVIVYFSTIYGSCEKTVAYVCETTPAEAARVEITYPAEDAFVVAEFERVARRLQAEGRRAKVAIFDTVVSLPGVRMPFEALAEKCRELGVLSCVDGAHGVGHVEIDLAKLDVDFFVSNCHKWLFTPRGAAVFYVPFRNQHLIRSTLPTSHGFIPRQDPDSPSIPNPLPASVSSPFVTAFNFVGTIDMSPYLCVPAALAYRQKIGGEAAIRSYCTQLAKEGGARVASLLGTRVMDNSTATLTNCCMVNVLLPVDVDRVVQIAGEKGVVVGREGVMGLAKEWMARVVVEEYGSFLAIILHGGRWWVRLSAQVYLEMKDFEWAAGVLESVCGRVGRGEFLDGKARM